MIITHPATSHMPMLNLENRRSMKRRLHVKQIAKKHLKWLKRVFEKIYETSDIVKFTNISSNYENPLCENGVEEARIISLKKNLCRKVVTHLIGFTFIETNRRYYVLSWKTKK